MKKLLIVESPAKIKTISKFLGKEFNIVSTVGHIVDLPPKKLGVTINDDQSIEIDYAPLTEKKKVIAEICKAASAASEIFLAPDPDREGEIIAWHVLELIKPVVKKNTKIHRITFNEITKSAVLHAIENPSEVDINKVNAQQARRVLDRWVGYEVSPILWKKLAPGTSAGRVQSVTLKLIVDRENEIRNFKTEEYWSIEGIFNDTKKNSIQASLTHIGKEKLHVTNEKDATQLVKEIKKTDFSVESITDKKRAKNPLPPFMTSTLQQAAFNKLGFGVKKTMTLAQKLYEGVPLSDPKTPIALITYMRTDSLRLADSALTQARDYIGKNYSKDYLPTSAQTYEKATSSKTKKDAGQPQDAHEAIRPIDVMITPEQAKKYLEKDMYRLYELIWKRFVACQMKAAQYAQRQVVIAGNPYIFKVTGSTLLFDGFLVVYSMEDEEEKEAVVKIPDSLQENEALNIKEITPKQHFTQPPPRYTEASLVKTMVKEGIGRPSTYSAILNTIQTRLYTTLDKKKQFSPTELGSAATEMLVTHLPHIMDLSFTAHMEQDLDEIAQGNIERDRLLKEFYSTFQDDVKKFKGTDSKRTPQPTEITCPTCKKHKLAIRFAKTGEFLGCLGYPECSFTSNFQRDENGNIELVKTEGPKVLDEKCPECGKNLRQIIGRFGPFIACSGYPDCKYIHQEKAPFKCPNCSSDIIERKWRGGKFWGCKGYPQCKFAIFGAIENTPCPQCKLPFLVKKTDKEGNVTLFCNDKECGYKGSL